MRIEELRTRTMELTLQFKGQALRLKLEEGERTTVEQLQREIQSLAGVPADAQRVFHGKKRVDTSQPQLLLVESCEGLASNGTLLLLAGATREKIQSMNETQTAAMEQQRIREQRAVVSIAQRNRQIQARDAVATSYRFHEIRVLDKLKDSEKAREILERLANDRGILAVMEKHKWSVGALSEMYPDGKVGVDPVCVLGLNKNKGQEILLRLRTDDLLGFRKYLSIKKVLFHELSHNVHSEHDSKFYQLMRQVERECDELDWTHSTGSATGGSSSNFAEEEISVESSSGSSGRMLGGASDRSTSRLLSEETKPQAQKTTAHKPSPSPPRKRSLEEAEQMEIDELPTIEAASPNEVESQESSTPSVPADAPAQNLQAASTPVQPLPELSDEFADFPMSERERRVYSALRTLQSHHDAQIVASAASVLYKIVSNIIQHPGESKYRSIRKANRVFESRVSRLPECLEFLLAVGFEDQSESFVLARDDPALLWIGRSTLEVMLPASA